MVAERRPGATLAATCDAPYAGFAWLASPARKAEMHTHLHSASTLPSFMALTQASTTRTRSFSRRRYLYMCGDLFNCELGSVN